MTNNFWFGKRVLVTGGNGFLASHLIKELIHRGACVTSTVRHNRPLDTLEMLGAFDGKGPHKPDIEHCDLLNFFSLRRVCDRHQIDTIFHLAATAIVSDAARSPMSTIENNVMSTLNVLEVARINNIPRVIVASTDKSYGDHADDTLEALPYKENYALRGLDVYSASKVCTDMVSQTYSYQFKLPVLVMRACNMFGPADLNFSRLIPRTIMRLLSGKAPHINLGNADVLREYMYVEDIVEAYLMMAQKIPEVYGKNNANMPVSGKDTYGWASYNVGSYTAEEVTNLSACEKIRSVTMVMELLRKKINDIEPVTKEKAANFIEIPDQYLDATKIKTLGYEPRVSFEEGLEKTVVWYKEHYDHLVGLAQRYIAD